MNKYFILGALLLTFATLCRAEVTASGEGGLTVSSTIQTTASPEDSWKAIVNHIGEWWHPDHTWSGKSANLYIRAEPGGCFCEHLPANAEGESGGVEHLRIIYLDPGRELRFDGTLGPFQTMAAQGRMIWKVEATETGSAVSFTYLVHGFQEGGFTGMAPAVDGVIKLQIDRLADWLNSH